MPWPYWHTLWLRHCHDQSAGLCVSLSYPVRVLGGRAPTPYATASYRGGNNGGGEGEDEENEGGEGEPRVHRVRG
jgi:hypothetical protein